MVRGIMGRNVRGRSRNEVDPHGTGTDGVTCDSDRRFHRTCTAGIFFPSIFRPRGNHHGSTKGEKAQPAARDCCERCPSSGHLSERSTSAAAPAVTEGQTSTQSEQMLISARHADGFQPTAEIAEENRATKAAAAWHAAITRRRASLGGNVGADPRRRSGSFKANSINGAGSIASSCGSSFGSSSMSRSGSTLTSRSSSSSLARSDSVGFGPSRFVLRQRYEDIRLRYLVHKEQLGTGEYGAVRPCVEADSGRLLACKTIRKQQITTYEDAEAIRTEVACLWEVRGHPSIISLHDAVEDGKRVHLVMELCHGGDLFRRVTQRGTLSERSAAKVCHALATAVLHCHRHGIMHRDIKPKNVLLLDDSDEPHVKLSDFGVATFFEDGDSLTEFAGTTQYIAPEVWKGQYGPEADIWGLGALLYFCIAGVSPYRAPTKQQVAEAVLTQGVDFSLAWWRKVSPECIDLIGSMLNKDPFGRITLVEVLQHSWIRRHANA